MADYISREALRDALYEQDAITMRGVAIINRFPAADVEPVRHGRWVHDGDYRSWSERIICSECGHFGGTYAYQLSPYCPRCGAKMQKGIYHDD